MKVSQVIATLTRKYAKQYPHADQEDMAQIACEAALRASRTWKPTGGAALHSYVWTAVNRALYIYVARSWAPVHGGDRRNAELLALRSGSVDTTAPHDFTEDGRDHGSWQLPMPSEQPDFDTLLDRARTFRRLHQLIEQQPEAAIALEYLLGEQKAHQVAAKLGCTVHEVRRVARSTRDAIRADDGLRAAARRL